MLSGGHLEPCLMISLCDVWSITQSFRETSAIFTPKFLLFSSVYVHSVYFQQQKGMNKFEPYLILAVINIINYAFYLQIPFQQHCIFYV